MSKQDEARKAQGYTLKLKTCADCQHFTSERVPIKWKVDINREIDKGYHPYRSKYDLDHPSNQREIKMRCTLGGFAVKRAACCDKFEPVSA